MSHNSHNSNEKQNQIPVSTDHEMRLLKLAKLRNLDIDPWPGPEKTTATCKEIINDYEKNEESKEYLISGRIMSIRLHGKAAFAHIQDRSGKVQLYIKQDIVGEKIWSFFTELIDIGDIIWCSGKSFRTKVGEITLEVKDLKLLSKCLYPLPEKFHGLTDIEVKYRQRYLDLMTNLETRERFIKRSKIIKNLRTYLEENDFIEVETPMLHPIPGGANAKPFVTHHNALDQDLYLRIAPELYLKRLVVGGLERVYEINRNFRNEGVSTKHNPEFTMVEFYMAYNDYHFIMNFVEDMFRKIAQNVCGTLEIKFGDYILDFSQPFLKISMRQSLITFGGLTEGEIAIGNIDSTLNKFNLKAKENSSYGEKIYLLFDELVEKKLIQPTFITDFPVEVSPLSKRDSNNPKIAARFEMFIAGMEISNGFNELNDPFDQADRFKEQAKGHEAGDEEAHRYDADYVHALEYALPPTVGVGIGIDRLVMLLTNTTSIKEVILFPTLKRKD